MKDPFEVARELRAHLGNPRWISSIGVGRRIAAGKEEGEPAIIVFLKREPPRGTPLPEEFQGYPVKGEMFGEFAPLGPVDTP